MVSRAIKISEENYKKLLRIASILQGKRGERATFDDALGVMEFEEKDERKPSDFAGIWEHINDKEAEKLIGEIYKERKVASRRL